MDTSNFLTIILILIFIILSALGVYLILLINEARHSLRRINRILDSLDALATFVENSFVRPASSLGAVAGVVKEGLDFARDLKKIIHKDVETKGDNYER